MEKSDSIIIIPTYNEKENIENIIRAVFGPNERRLQEKRRQQRFPQES